MDDHKRLKARHRAERDGFQESLSLRVHRALSWLQRAEQLGQEGDLDGQFVFLWIAFNAAYATEIDERYRQTEQETFRAFLQKLADLDSGGGRFEALVWTEFSQGIRVLLNNPYVFQPFWDFHNQRLGEQEWKERFAAAKRAAQVALGRRDTVTVLSIVLARIYTLRNQIIHGGATWKSGVNRDQLRDCVKLMGKLVPLIIEIMMDHPETLWGEGCYPVVR